MKRITWYLLAIPVCAGIILVGLALGESAQAASGHPLPGLNVPGLTYGQSDSPTVTPISTMPPMSGMPGMSDMSMTPEANITATPDGSGMNMGNGSATMAATMAMGNMPGMEMDSCYGQPVTASDQTAVDQLVAQVKTDALRFADPAVALAEGYKQVTAYPIPGKNGKWGPAHFLNKSYTIRDVVVQNPINPDQPGALVYFRLPSGKMMLLGEMFLAPRGKGACPGGGLTVWHNHTNLCFANGTANMVGFMNAQGACPAGSTNKSTMDMLHVWVFNNPDGPLATDLTKQDYVAAYQQCMKGSPWCQ